MTNPRSPTTLSSRALFVLALMVGPGACKSSSNTSPASAQDAAGVDQQAAEISAEAGPADMAPDAGANDGAAQGDAAAGDALAVDCVPAPTGGPAAAGTAPMLAPGPVVASAPTRPELLQAVADDQYTVRKALAQGGAITGPGTTVSDGGITGAGGAGNVTYTLSDSWDPLTNGIGDPSTFHPMFTVAADGTGTHTTVSAAITDSLVLSTCGRVYIRLMPGTYREQVTVPSKASAPLLTLYSTETDASKTAIVFNASTAAKGSTSSSATLTIKALTGFQMKNLTVSNDYVEGSSPGADQSAVALLNQTDRAQFENVRILGNAGTLYLKSLDVFTKSRSYFRDSYVEGDQDIILGRGTAVFDHTEIKVLSARQPTGGVIAHPSTLVYNPYGFLFDSCAFTAEAGASGTFLGHQWFEGANPAAIGKMIVRNSTLGSHIAATPWSTQDNRTTTPKDPAGTTPVLLYTSDDYYPAGTGPSPAEPYLAEYGNSGPGAHQ